MYASNYAPGTKFNTRIDTIALYCPNEDCDLYDEDFEMEAGNDPWGGWVSGDDHCPKCGTERKERNE